MQYSKITLGRFMEYSECSKKIMICIVKGLGLSHGDYWCKGICKRNSRNYLLR
jgi:hypothetical protein